MFRPSILRSTMGSVVAFGLLAAPSLAKHDNWVQVRTANFVVISDANESAAQTVASRFEQIRAVFNTALPIATAHPSPVITILALKDAESFRQVLGPLSQRGHAQPAGIFSHRLDQFYIVLPIDALDANSYTTIYHEYFHSLTAPYYPNLPAWLAEGLAEFYGSTRIDSSGVTTGLSSPSHVARLEREPLIPLPVLFHVDHSSPYYNEDLKASVFYAESWALTHYLMVGDGGTHKQSLLKYLAAVNRGESSGQAAGETLGDLALLERGLAQYVRNASFSNLQVKMTSPGNDADFKAQKISEIEAAAYRGGFLAVQGQTTEAIRILQKTVSADPNSPLAWRNLSAAYFFGGQRAKASEAASTAITLEPNEVLTHYIRAYLAFNGSMLPPNPQMEADLRAAIAVSANFGSPYSMLAAYLAAQNTDLNDALAAAQKAVSFEPGNSAAQLILAKVLGRLKRYDEARAAASVALAHATNPSERAGADQFLMFLDKTDNLSINVTLTAPPQRSK